MTTGLTSELPGAQQADLPPEAAEDSEPLKGVDDGAIVARLGQLVTACEQHASQRYQTIRRQWRLYHDQYDWSQKQQWQSKIAIPRVFSTVESAVALYMAGLIPSEKWFRVEDSWRGDYARSYAVEEIQRQNLRAAGFYDVLRLGLLAGFLGGMIPLKVGVDSRGPIPYPVYQLWDPLDIRLDWSGRNRFLVLESEVEPYQLKDWAEQGLYDEERVDKAIKSSLPGTMRGKRSAWEGTIPGLLVQEFWGDFLKEDGTAYMRNCTFTVVNKQVVLRRPIENPFYHGMPPLILGMPLRVPYRVWAAGLIEHVEGPCRMITELANVIMDASLYAAVQAYQYDIRRVRQADLRRGMYPGKMFGVTDLQMGPAIERFEAGQVPTDALGVVSWLDTEIQRDTGVTEHTSGREMPGGRQKTAREVERYLGQSMTIIRTMARDLETSFLEPLLDMTLSVYAQVTAKNPQAFFQPELLGQLGPQWALMMKVMDEEMRAEVLTRGVRHQARGISSSISVNEDLQRLLAFAEAASKDPEMWGRVNKRALLEKVVSLHRQSPDELLIPEEEYQRQAAMQAQIAQVMAGAGPAGGGGQAVERRRQLMPGEPRQLPQLAALS